MTAVLLALGGTLVLAAVLLVLLAETVATAPLRVDGAVLPRGGVLPALARRLDALVGEVSGFVTDGELQVVAVEPVEPDHERNLRWFAGALQHGGEGPVARAIARLATDARVTDVRRVPGAGIEGSVDRHPVRVGDPGWIGVAPPLAAGGHTVAVEVDGRTLGSITVAERVRREAPGALERIERAGYATTLVSSAGELEAKRLAKELARDVAAVDAGGLGAVLDDLRGAGRCVVHVGASRADDQAGVALRVTDAAHRGVPGSAPVVVLDDLAAPRVELFLVTLRRVPERARRARLGGLGLAVAGLVPVVVGAAGWWT